MQPDMSLLRSDLERLLEKIAKDDARPPRVVVERIETELERADLDEATARVIATIGTRIEFETVKDGTRRTVRLVMPDDVEEPGDLSVLSQVGVTLLGLRAGDVVTWNDKGKRRRFRVLRVEPP